MKVTIKNILESSADLSSQGGWVGLCFMAYQPL